MHVLVLPSWYPTTEAPRNGIYFVEQIQCLQEAGLRMGVVYPEQQSLRRCTAAALRRKHFQTEWTHGRGIPTLRRYGWNVWWRLPPGQRLRVRHAVRLGRQYADAQGRPDLLHAHSARWAGAAAARLSDELGVPYVLSEHYSGFRRNAIPAWRRPLVREGFDAATATTAVSTSLRETLASQDFVAPDTVTILPNVVDGSFFSRPPDDRPSLPPFRFITVARLHPAKNVSGLLEAFATAFPTSDRVVLSVVGDGPERGALERRAHQLGLTDRVTFHGTLDRPALRDALWAAHAFVLPSHHETFGVVLIEAMATGLPVIATRSGGPADIVTPDTGLLVPSGQTEALASALRRMRAQREEFTSSVIRDSALARYGPEPFVERTTDLYHHVLR